MEKQEKIREWCVEAVLKMGKPILTTQILIDEAKKLEKYIAEEEIRPKSKGGT